MKDFVTNNQGNPRYAYRKKESNGDISSYLKSELTKVSSRELRRKDYYNDAKEEEMEIEI